MAREMKTGVFVFLLVLSITVATCTLVGAASLDPVGLFAENYQEARSKFLKAAKDRGGEVTSFRNPASGPDGATLYTDVARFGPIDPRYVLVISSGTHGVEGFAGSAIQVGLLLEESKALIPPMGRIPGFGLVMVHAVNPYGFANLRRFNEDNVDVNRNFWDHTIPAPRNEGYESLHDVIAPTSISALGDFWARVRLYWYRLWNGSKALQAAVSVGQYSHRKGLFYGGVTDSWSKRTMEEIIRRFVAGASRVIVIDIHTGLGPFGNAEVITSEPKDSPAYLGLTDLWGDSVRTTHRQESVSVKISGAMKLVLPQLLPDAEVTSVNLEFGTYPGQDVFWALREENWLQHHGGEDHADRRRIKTALLRMFYPDDDQWKRQVWNRGKEIVSQAVAGIK